MRCALVNLERHMHTQIPRKSGMPYPSFEIWHVRSETPRKFGALYS